MAATRPVHRIGDCVAAVASTRLGPGDYEANREHLVGSLSRTPADAGALTRRLACCKAAAVHTGWRQR